MPLAPCAMPHPHPPSIRSHCKEGFRRNRLPALILQALAALVLLLYFLSPGLRPVFDAVAIWKRRYGIGFSIFSTVLFGGIIPWAVMWHRGRIPQGERLKQFLFYAGFWALQGMMVDRLYTQQNEWFGPENDFPTLLRKVLVDQLPYNLIWATPNSLLLYGWKNAGFSWSRFRIMHPTPVLFRKYLTIQISAWITWVPSVSMIYSLPVDLQIPLFNLVLCFYSLVLAFVSRPDAAA
ncbi:MAG: hypothetical protein ACO3N7_03905 [Kiritimatiellia bacterium]